MFFLLFRPRPYKKKTLKKTQRKKSDARGDTLLLLLSASSLQNKHTLSLLLFPIKSECVRETDMCKRTSSFVNLPCSIARFLLKTCRGALFLIITFDLVTHCQDEGQK